MQQISFKNRIASNYILTTALLIFLVFTAIYITVKWSVYSHLNQIIKQQVQIHLSEIEVTRNSIKLIHNEEWLEREHNTVDVNPLFIQILNSKNQIIEKSPNLKNHVLKYNDKANHNELFDSELLDNAIRQIQVPLYYKEKLVGYLIIATSLKDSAMVLNNLIEILIFAYPIILIILFVIARFFAGRSIKPIQSIIQISNLISKDNLKSRILLPQIKDELFILSKTINNLLDRLENALEREKKFTSDASHELRTPLTIIKGTLEVLVRKQRSTEEYETKINFCINEVDRLNHLVDQLLLLARFENQKQSLKLENICLNDLVLNTVSRFNKQVQHNNIGFNLNFEKDFFVNSDNYLLSIIVDNLVSNAIKYSHPNSDINIKISNQNNNILVQISDKGIGIPHQELEKIFNQFYRANADKNQEIKGNGLGLCIVKRLCELLNITIEISSAEGKGTTATLSIS